MILFRMHGTIPILVYWGHCLLHSLQVISNELLVEFDTQSHELIKWRQPRTTTVFTFQQFTSTLTANNLSDRSSRRVRKTTTVRKNQWLGQDFGLTAPGTISNSANTRENVVESRFWDAIKLYVLEKLLIIRHYWSGKWLHYQITRTFTNIIHYVPTVVYKLLTLFMSPIPKLVPHENGVNMSK